MGLPDPGGPGGHSRPATNRRKNSAKPSEPDSGRRQEGRSSRETVRERFHCMRYVSSLPPLFILYLLRRSATISVDTQAFEPPADAACAERVVVKNPPMLRSRNAASRAM